MSTNRALLDLISNLNLNNGNTIITMGNGGRVTVSSGTNYIGNSITLNQKTLSLNGRDYSLDDPTATDNMPESEQEMFWSLCSDKGKDSDLYRAYAKSILSNANVDLNAINNEELKLIIINQATNVAKLAEYLSQLGVTNWMKQLCNNSSARFETYISHAYDVTELMKGLRQVGYLNPLEVLDTIEISRLKQFINHRYDTVEFFKGLSGLGYRLPLQSLLSISREKLEEMYSHRYDTLELMKAFKDVGNRDPLNELTNIPQDRLQDMFSHRYDSIELMKCFNQLNYSNPLKTLVDLDRATLLLFYQHRYDSIEILKALYKSGQRNPIAYLQNLGKDAMITMLNARYEYVNRINRGVDLMREFKPTNNVDNEYRPELQKFLDDLAGKESYQRSIARLQIDSDDLVDFKDTYTGNIVDIPVRLDGDLFDLNFLVGLQQDREGYRTHPVSGDKFALSSLQSAKDIQRRLDKLIDSAHAKQNSNFRM